MLCLLVTGDEKNLRNINQRKHLKIVDVCDFKNIVIQKEFHAWVRRYFKMKPVASSQPQFAI